MSRRRAVAAFLAGRIRPAVAALALSLSATGCTKQMLLTGMPGDLMSKGRVPEMIIQLKNGNRVVLRHPEVSGDSVWGAPATNLSVARLAIANSDIEWASASVVNSDSQKTFGTTLVITAVVVLPVLILILCCGGGP